MIITVGLLAGVSSGILLGANVVELYRKFFRFPALMLQTDYAAIGVAVVLSFGSTLMGVSGALWQAMRLPPAQGMRPSHLPKFTPSLFERAGIHQFLGRSTRMAFRNLERKPWRGFVTALGIAMATGISIVPGALRDSIEHLTDLQWTQMQRQDVTISFTEPGSASAFRDLRRMAAVVEAEPFRSIPVRIHFGHRSRTLSVIGLPDDARLTRMFDVEGRALDLPPTGLLASKKLADLLGARVGDRLLVQFLEGPQPRHELVLHGLIGDYHGLNAVMNINAVRQLMLERETINGAHLKIDPLVWSDFLESVKAAPRIATLRNQVRDEGKFSTVDGGITATDPKNLFHLCNSSRLRSRLYELADRFL